MFSCPCWTRDWDPVIRDYGHGGYPTLCPRFHFVISARASPKAQRVSQRKSGYCYPEKGERTWGTKNNKYPPEATDTQAFGFCLCTFVSQTSEQQSDGYCRWKAVQKCFLNVISKKQNKTKKTSRGLIFLESHQYATIGLYLNYESWKNANTIYIILAMQTVFRAECIAVLQFSRIPVLGTQQEYSSWYQVAKVLPLAPYLAQNQAALEFICSFSHHPLNDRHAAYSPAILILPP